MALTHEDYYTALDVYFDHFDTVDDTERPVYLTIFPNCEKTLFIEQAKRNLSSEAKDVMEMLLTCPSEIYEEITTDTGKFNTNKLRKYLKECCLPHKTITNIFSELKQLKREMEEL